MISKSLRKKYKAKKRVALWRNPFLHLFFFLILFPFFVFYSFFLNPFFTVRDIFVEGSEELRPIVSATLRDYEGENVFSFSPPKIKDKIISENPKAEKVFVSRTFPNIINIKIKERSPIGVWCQKSADCFNIDVSGIVFEQSSPEGADFVFYKEDENISLGEKVINEKEISSMNEIKRVLLTNGIKVSFFNFYQERTLEVFTFDGWKILFFRDADTRTQLENLLLVLDEKISEEDVGLLEYIDLRYGNRVYYK